MVMMPTANSENENIFDANDYDRLHYHNILGAIFNLRKELARQIKLVRIGKINVAEASENTRDLVLCCHPSIMDDADRLQHKIMGQITKQYGKHQLIKSGIECNDIKTPSVKTRSYLPSHRPKNRLG